MFFFFSILALAVAVQVAVPPAYAGNDDLAGPARNIWECKLWSEYGHWGGGCDCCR